MSSQKPRRDRRPVRLATTAVHAGESRTAAPVGPVTGADGALGADGIGTPLFPSSTYLLGDPGDFDDIRYVRLNNTPNQVLVGRKLAALEQAEAALVSPSGTAAIAMTLEAMLRPGDHVVTMEALYGGTRKIFDRLLPPRGVSVSYVPADDLEAWGEAIGPSTRLLYAESMMNPCLDVPPLDGLVSLARDRGLLSVIDNTICSPVGFRPVPFGFDLVVHSASKYLNGHTDVVAGVVAGDAERVETIRRHMNLAGVCLDPHGCHLLQRGLKTLPLRVPAQTENAARLAELLASHPRVSRVHYPGLPGDPAHGRARAYFDGFGAMVTFVPEGGPAVADAVLGGLEIGQIAPSLGGLETLVSRPATTSHAGLPPELRRRMGVTDDMVRVSVGIEDAEDLLADFDAALHRAARPVLSVAR